MTVLNLNLQIARRIDPRKEDSTLITAITDDGERFTAALRLDIQNNARKAIANYIASTLPLDAMKTLFPGLILQLSSAGAGWAGPTTLNSINYYTIAIPVELRSRLKTLGISDSDGVVGKYVGAHDFDRFWSTYNEYDKPSNTNRQLSESAATLYYSGPTAKPTTMYITYAGLTDWTTSDGASYEVFPVNLEPLIVEVAALFAVEQSSADIQKYISQQIPKFF
jgi:hypothetical protein